VNLGSPPVIPAQHTTPSHSRLSHPATTRGIVSGHSSLRSQSTYICRVQSSVWRRPNIDPPHSPPSHLRPASVSCPPPPPTKGTHSPGDAGVGGQYFARRQILDWPLQYNPSTPEIHYSIHSYPHSIQKYDLGFQSLDLLRKLSHIETLWKHELFRTFENLWSLRSNYI
jgi:hypothetical protein